MTSEIQGQGLPSNYHVMQQNDYLQYWNFTNKKLTEMLSKLDKNKYRIILTGDHGLRGMPTNPHSTFTAFYGFDSTALKSIHSVQDIGNLINGSF